LEDGGVSESPEEVVVGSCGIQMWSGREMADEMEASEEEERRREKKKGAGLVSKARMGLFACGLCPCFLNARLQETCPSA
jgi:hypothetical protein